METDARVSFFAQAGIKKYFVGVSGAGGESKSAPPSPLIRGTSPAAWTRAIAQHWAGERTQLQQRELEFEHGIIPLFCYQTPAAKRECRDPAGKGIMALNRKYAGLPDLVCSLSGEMARGRVGESLTQLRTRRRTSTRRLT